MNPEPDTTRRTLIKDVLLLQVKLLLDALRDLALSPLTLAAAAIDCILAGRQPPRYFYAVLRLGERSEHWIDLWSAARGAKARDRENVDALIARVEEVVRDPKVGARQARVLKRWAERQARRALARPPADSGSSESSDSKPG
jgi:hypothetical protein